MLNIGGPALSVAAHTNGGGYGAVIIYFKSGVIGTLQLVPGPAPSREQYSFFGEGWQVNIFGRRVEVHRGIPFQYDTTDNYAPAGISGGTVVYDTENCLATLENKALFTQGIAGEMRYFCECALNNKPAGRSGLELSLDIMRVYEAALLSNGRGVIVNV
jgi:predicted dehydrogenase